MGTFSAYFTLRISNYEIYMQERFSVQNEKGIYPAASNDWACMGLDGNKETHKSSKQNTYLCTQCTHVKLR